MPLEILQARIAKLTEVIVQSKDIPPEDAITKLTELQDICRSDASTIDVIFSPGIQSY